MERQPTSPDFDLLVNEKVSLFVPTLDSWMHALSYFLPAHLAECIKELGSAS